MSFLCILTSLLFQLPSDSRNPNLPVMVYIHGGAFMMGGYVGAGPGRLLERYLVFLFTLCIIIKITHKIFITLLQCFRDMVLVEIQYRLGPLGKQTTFILKNYMIYQAFPKFLKQI